jgi:transposase-like protein
MKSCDSIAELAGELGVHRSVLYDWRDQLARLYRTEWQKAEEAGESPLARENRLLKQAWEKRYWKWIFSKVPCKKSGLDARATASLARRPLRPNPGVDVGARQTEYRADV